MHTLTIGDVSIARIVEIGRSSFPTDPDAAPSPTRGR